MRNILVIFGTLFLVSCSSSMSSDISDTTYSSTTKTSFDCPKDSMPIFGQSKQIVGCSPLSQSKDPAESVVASSGVTRYKNNCNASGSLVSGETCYMIPDINAIGLSDYDAKKIATKLFRKREDHIYHIDALQNGLISKGERYSTSYNFTQGDWSATYTPPKYFDIYDSIVLKSAKKKYTFTGVVYAKENRDRYLGMIKEGHCRLDGQELEQYKQNNFKYVEVDGVYYRPPSSGDCSMMKDFEYFTSISPDGRYITYDVSGYEYLSTMILDTVTGKTSNAMGWSSVFQNGQNLGFDTSASNIIWSPDSVRIGYTTAGFYCLAQKSGSTFSDIKCQKSNSFNAYSSLKMFDYIGGVYYAIEILDDGISKFQLRGFDGDTFEEVYSRNIGPAWILESEIMN